MTKEEIFNNNWKFTSGPPILGMSSIFQSMDEYAKQQAISFMNWTLESDCQYSCSDENQWTNINNPYDSITTEQLHGKFIEQQNKP